MNDAPPGASAAGGSRLRGSAHRRRVLLFATAGAAALAAGVLARHWGEKPPDRVVAGITLHSTPSAMPPLRFASGTGAALDLASFRGRAVLLNVWATWCGPCREEMPTLDRLQALLGGAQFEVVALSIDAGGMAAVTPFFEQIGVRHLRPYVDAFNEAGAIVRTGVPLTFLIDMDGQEVGRKLGGARWDDPAVLDVIRRHLIADKKEKSANG
jgi:thiol-disulfide isomerase/thioredoxin